MKRLGLALVPEDRKTKGLVLGLSTLDNACLASLDRVGRRGWITRRMQRAAVAPLVRDLAIAAPDLDQPVSSLSGGNQQKVVVGKWLNTRPAIVLFDEPTRGIDVRAKQQMFEILRRLSGEGIASLIVSSELEELVEVCHRILVMRGGRIVDELSPEGLSLDRLFGLCMQG